MTNSVKTIKDAKPPRIPAPKVSKIKIEAPKITQAQKQIAALDKQYAQQEKALALQYKAFGLHSVAEKASTGTRTPAFRSQGTPYHRVP